MMMKLIQEKIGLLCDFLWVYIFWRVLRGRPPQGIHTGNRPESIEILPQIHIRIRDILSVRGRFNSVQSMLSIPPNF